MAGQGGSTGGAAESTTGQVREGRVLHSNSAIGPAPSAATKIPRWNSIRVEARNIGDICLDIREGRFGLALKGIDRERTRGSPWMILVYMA